MPNIALLFPGQGSQYIKMGTPFMERFPVVNHVFEEASDALGINIRNIICESTLKELTRSENAQPAIVTVNQALLRIFQQEIGAVPQYTAGHSLGEISALIAAGAMTFYEGVRFVRTRGRLMQEAYDKKLGSMGLVVNMDENETEMLTEMINRNGEYAIISGYNTPKQLLVSGSKQGLRALSKEVRNRKGEFIPFSMVPMKVDAPFHSILMQFARKTIEDELNRMTLSPLNWPVISNIDARPYNAHSEIADKLSRQIVSPVRWRQSMAYMVENGVRNMIEIGPQTVLKNMMQEISTTVDVYAIDDTSDFKKMHSQL